MSTSAFSHPVLRLLVRRYVELLTVLTVLFILLTGLVPFDFVGERATTGSTAFFGTTTNRPIIPDVVSNIFLYVPLGVLLHWTLLRATRGGALVLPATVILAALLSGTVEWIQAYMPMRVSSLIDFVGNIVGVFLGASVSWLARRLMPPMLGAALIEFHQRPSAALLKTYTLILFVFAAVPFSFSFDTIRLKQAVKSANFVPFQAETTDTALSNDVLSEGDYAASAHLKWRYMKRWSRWAAECASFAMLALLLQPVLRGDYRFGRRTATMLTIWLGGLLAVSLSAMQFIIVTRVCDVTDVLFRLLGLAVGIVARAHYLRDPERLAPELRMEQWIRLAKVGYVATVAYIFYTGLIPLTFDAGRGGAAASLAADGFLPFYGYFTARFDVMMADAMEKFASYAVFAALLATCWGGVRDLETRWRVSTILTAGVAISVLIEIAQMFMLVRVTSLTDPMLAAAGCLTGVLAQQHGAKFFRFAASRAAPAAEREGAPSGFLHDLPPADALVATLTEQKSDAPSEPSPAPRRRTAR